MKILIACEFSATVRNAFRARGHDAWSCDLLPCEKGQNYHIQDDVRKHLHRGWDGLIMHPPCDYLTNSGNRWFRDDVTAAPGVLVGAARRQARIEAYEFAMELWNAPIPLKALENPIGALSSMWRKPDQIIQPWMFGHGETKATCLWLQGWPKLQPTNVVEGREARIHRMAPGANRWKERSKTLSGIAFAMAEQWG